MGQLDRSHGRIPGSDASSDGNPSAKASDSRARRSKASEPSPSRRESGGKKPLTPPGKKRAGSSEAPGGWTSPEEANRKANHKETFQDRKGDGERRTPDLGPVEPGSKGGIRHVH